MPESARETMDEALRLLADGEREAGIACLRATVGADPGLAEAWGHLSWNLALAGRHEEALACNDRILELRAGDPEARWRRGDRLARLGRFDEAEATYRAVLDSDPACADAVAGLQCVEWMRRQGRTRDEGPRTKDQGPRTEDQGRRTEGEGQRTGGEGQRTKEGEERPVSGFGFQAEGIARSQSPDTGLQAQPSSPQPPTSSLQTEDSRLKPPASSLQPPDSSLKPPTSSLQPPVSGLKPPPSRLQPPASRLKPPDSSLQPPASENERRARFHLDRGDRRLASMPFHLHLETSTRCNCACVTCGKGHGPYFAEDMRHEVFERVGRELLPTARRVNLTGSGEPLLGSGVVRFYDAAFRAGARVYLVTNATLLTMTRIAKFARQPTDLIASIDGATAETFESIRRPSKFDRVIGALRRYKKMRDIHPEVGSTLGINFVAMRRNIEELPALVDLAAELGAEFVAVLDFATADVPPEIAREHLRFSPDLANRSFDQAAERAKARGIALHLPPKFGPTDLPPEATRVQRFRGIGRLLPERNRFPQRCPDPWTTTLISTSGLVHPCCASRRVMGDLNEQSFAEVWNGRRYRRFRRWIRTPLPPPECRQCNQLWGVNAGNPSAVRAKEGLLLKALYRAKEFWSRLVLSIRFRLSPPPSPPKPNYSEGRPIREKREPQLQ